MGFGDEQELLKAFPLRGRWPEGPDEVASNGKLSWTCPLISHGSAVPAFSVERLRRLLHSPGNAPLAHSCFGLTPQGEAFGNPYKPQFAHRSYKQHSAEPTEMGSALHFYIPTSSF